MDETTVGAENLPLTADGPLSSPDLPLSRAAPSLNIKQEEADLDQLAAGRPVDGEEFKDDVREGRTRPDAHRTNRSESDLPSPRNAIE